MLARFTPIQPTVETGTDEYVNGSGQSYEIHPFPRPLELTRTLEVLPENDEIWTPQALSLQFLFRNRVNVQLDIHSSFKELTEQIALLQTQKAQTLGQKSIIVEAFLKEPAGSVHRRELEAEGESLNAAETALEAAIKATEIQRSELGAREVLEIFRQSRFLTFTGAVVHVPSNEPVWIGTIEPNQYTEGQIFNVVEGSEPNTIRVLATNIVYAFNSHIPLVNAPRISRGEQLQLTLKIYGAGENNLSRAETAVGTDLHLDVKESNFGVSVTSEKQ